VGRRLKNARKGLLLPGLPVRPVDHASLANRAIVLTFRCQLSRQSRVPVEIVIGRRRRRRRSCPMLRAKRSTHKTHLPVLTWELTWEHTPSQTTDLPTEGTESPIPRDGAGN